jgi:hypothetical protein
VVAELAQAKLVYLGSAHLTDSVDRVNFTEAQQALLASLDDPILREETRDMLLGRQFRRDVFAKGITATSEASLRARWLDMRFALISGERDFDMTFDTPVGKLQLRADVHGPFIDLLRQGPVTLREAFERLPQSASNWASIADVIKILIGRGDLQPALPADGDASRAASVRAFNDAVLARAMESAEFGYLASAVTGGGVRVDRLAQLYLYAGRRSVADPIEMLAKLALAAPPSGDEKPPTMEGARDFAKTQAARIETEVLPLLRKLAVV